MMRMRGKKKKERLAAVEAERGGACWEAVGQVIHLFFGGASRRRPPASASGGGARPGRNDSAGSRAGRRRADAGRPGWPSPRPPSGVDDQHRVGERVDGRLTGPLGAEQAGGEFDWAVSRAGGGVHGVERLGQLPQFVGRRGTARPGRGLPAANAQQPPGSSPGRGAVGWCGDGVPGPTARRGPGRPAPARRRTKPAIGRRRAGASRLACFHILLVQVQKWLWRPS